MGIPKKKNTTALCQTIWREIAEKVSEIINSKTGVTEDWNESSIQMFYNKWRQPNFHIPVLFTQSQNFINKNLVNQIIADGTLGGGGYTKLIWW